MKVRYGKIIIITDAYFDGQHIFFFFQAEDGIRDKLVTGVQTCALPILTTTVPTGSGNREPSGSRDSSSSRGPRIATAMPIGTFRTKTERQPHASTNSPPI